MSNSRFKAWFSDKIFQNLLQLASQVKVLAMASMHEFLGLQMITTQRWTESQLFAEIRIFALKTHFFEKFENVDLIMGITHNFCID